MQEKEEHNISICLNKNDDLVNAKVEIDLLRDLNTELKEKNKLLRELLEKSKLKNN